MRIRSHARVLINSDIDAREVFCRVFRKSAEGRAAQATTIKHRDPISPGAAKWSKNELKWNGEFQRRWKWNEMFFTSRRQSEMKMKWKVEAKADHRGGPKIESWERIYAYCPAGVVQPRRGWKIWKQLWPKRQFEGFGGCNPTSWDGQAFFHWVLFEVKMKWNENENENMKSKLNEVKIKWKGLFHYSPN